MATRASSRRSAGGADVLNRATIHLLGLQRLKEELTKLGLPLDGSKEALADRLEDWINGVYVPPPVTLVTTSSTPSTSRNHSAKNTPGTRPNSAKGPAAKRTPRRKSSVGSAGDEESPPKPVEAPPKKKPRRNSTKKEQPSPDCSTKEGEPREEVFEEVFSVTIVDSTAQFDPEDDEPLIKLKSKGVAAAAATAAAAAATTSPAAPSVENGRSDEKEGRKKKRRRKDDDDIASGALLAKGDSEWVPPEETDKRSTRESAKKRTRKNTSDVRDEPDEPEETSSMSMPVLDPEIYDQEGDERPRKTVEPVKSSSDRQRKPSIGEGGKKVKQESGTAVAVDRTRSMGTSSGAVISKEKRRESTGAAAAALPPRPPREKPATLQFAELMAQRKAALTAAAAAAAANKGVVGGTTPAATLSSTVAKKESSQEKEKEASGGGVSPLVADKAKSEQSARRESIGAAGSPAADAAAAAPSPVAAAGAPRGFQMNPRKNGPPRPSAGGGSTAGLPDLLGDLLGKQQVLLKKNVKSTAEAEAEKIRIVSQIKQRAPDLKDREETVNKEKERVAREEEEKRRAREERERRAKEERERKARIIAAPTRPIPPPPPLPAVKLENSPQELSPSQQAAADAAAAAVAAASALLGSKVPKIEPLEEEEEEVEMKYQPPTAAAAMAGDIEPPEYEPLFPGPSMPLLDRAIADAHHRLRAERKKEKKEKSKKRGSKDHGLIAPEVPFSANDPFMLSLSDKLKKIAKQRERSPILPEVRECMDDLLAKVESKVEKEQKWERRTKRKSEYQVEREKEQEKKRAQMMADPLALLAKANTIFESMHNNGSIDEDTVDSPASGTAVQISQDLAEPGTYEEDTEDKPLPEFHGEPVPSDDDEALFLEAAGLPKKDRRPKHPVVEEEAPPSHEHILMDYYNACLHVKSATDKPWLIEPDNEHGLALMWGGVRTNHGYVLPWREEKEGKKAMVFQIKITEHQGVRHIPFNEQEPHDVRIGFSLRASPNIMGEAPLSWAFSTTGRKCVNNSFQEWGQPCELGDIVTAVLDFSSSCVSFYRNDEYMGVAFSGVGLPDGDAVYAHVCVKNCKVAVNLGEFPPVDGGWRTVSLEEKKTWDEEERRKREEAEEKKRKAEEDAAAAAAAAALLQLPPPPPPAPPKGPPPRPAPLVIPPLGRHADWAFPTEIERRRFEMSRLPPNEKASCTLLMMVGLPGVGKSTWVRQYIRDHPEEKWDVINAEAVMAAMKVNGVARGRAHTGRWDMVLGLVAKALQKMVLLAARRRRNYIVDLSNVNKDSRKRKLMHFKDFTKKCVVLVPDEEEMVRRQMQQTRQDGASHVPAAAILEMKAVFSYPGEEAEGIDVVHLIEPPMTRIADAIEIIHRFNVEGKPWFPDRYRGRGSRRGRGGYGGGGGGDRRGSDYNRPLSVSTAASNGSGPPTGGAAGGGPSPRGWGMAESPSTTAGHFSWAARKSSN